MKHCAYDYERQVWVANDPRRSMALQIKQEEQTLELLTGPRARDYAAFTGMPVEQIPFRVATLQSIIRELKRDLAGMISHENFNHSAR